MDLMALDADAHVEEWEGTFSDEYFEPAFRDRRPQVVRWDGPDDFEVDYAWLVDGTLMRLGGSPSTKDGIPNTEHLRMEPWRGSFESAELHSAGPRLEVLDEEDTLISVNYPTLLLRWPLAQDPLLNGAITRSYNNWIGDTCGQAPDRLKWVAVVDPTDPAEAVREIVRTKEMGAVGLVMFGHYGGVGLDDPRFDPIWSAAQEVALPVNIHPGFPALDAIRDYPAVAYDQFMTSVVRGFKTIVTGGILDRYPDLVVSFQETGCTWVDFAIEDLSFLLDNAKDRIRMNALRSEQRAAIKRGLPQMTPLEYIQAGRIFIGFEVDDDLLPYMVDKYGVGCWTYASDIPHTHRKVHSAQMLMDRADLPDDVKRRLLHEGTAKLYGLDVPEPTAPAGGLATWSRQPLLGDRQS